MKINIPANTLEIMNEVVNNGYECYLVGGAVRDIFLNEINKDYDFATNIPFSELKKIYPNLVLMKENNHRNTAIIRNNGVDYEFSQFRGMNIYEDLKKRDFKVNSIAVNCKSEVIDPYDGLKDLENGIISLNEEDGSGFIADPLRIFRAIRLSDKYNFNISNETKNQMIQKKELLKNVSKERIITELNKIILSDKIDKYLIEYKELFFVIIPELYKCDKFLQYNDYHVYDVFEHISKVVVNSPKNLYVRYAALFHDIGKPKTFVLENGIGHFLRHAEASFDVFKRFSKLYKLDNLSNKIIGDLILYHEDELSIKPNKIYNFYKKYSMNRIELLFDLKKADVKSQNIKYIDRLDLLNDIELKYIEIRSMINEIKYNGDELIKLGYDGKIIGLILDDIKRKIVNGQINNDKIDIEKYVLKNYERSY